MEHDHGDPDAYRDEIDAAVRAAIAVGSYYYPPVAVLALVREQIVDLVNWLFDTDDDVISTETVVFSRVDLERLSTAGRSYHMGVKKLPTMPPVDQPITTNLFQHFVTTHRGEGAHYIVAFDIVRDPEVPAGGVIL
jgi:hypothetical protein